jgi:hypothetical protein
MAWGGSETAYCEENAELVIKALRSGRRPGPTAQLVGVGRRTLYNWKAENADFAAAWDDAVATAADRMEEVVYDLGIAGDLAAAAYWLKHRKPERFDSRDLGQAEHHGSLAEGRAGQREQAGDV